MQKIVPNLWFNGNAEKGGEFYASAFPHASAATTMHYPSEGLPDFQRSFAGKPLTVDVDIDGFVIRLINAGDDFAPTPAMSFMVNFDPSRDTDARSHIDEVWQRLADGGQVLMELDEYPYSPRYGWVQDRFGVSWQLILTNPEGDPRPFIMPSLLFSGAAQNRAAEAIAEYTSLVPNSEAGMQSEYPEQTGPATAGALQFAEFTLAGQWFTAMDSGVEQPFSFTPGTSLEVRCADQAEIDRLWQALSAVPEAEQCGWLQDRFGVSWQIVPADMDELVLSSPKAYLRMLDMKKIEIAGLAAD